MNHVEIAYSIPGQTWPRELTWLSTAFASSRVHVEVGVYCGRSFYVSCMGLPRGALAIAVDDDSEPNVGTGFAHPCPEWVPTIREMTLEAIRKARPDLTVEFWPESSIDASRRLWGMRHVAGPVSVFIDGAHDYESVTGDIGAWQAFLNQPRSMLCGHDYWAANSPVMDAVNHLLPHFDVIHGTRIWSVKR